MISKSNLKTNLSNIFLLQWQKLLLTLQRTLKHLNSSYENTKIQNTQLIFVQIQI